LNERLGGGFEKERKTMSVKDAVSSAYDKLATAKDKWSISRACNAASLGTEEIKSAVEIAEKRTGDAIAAGEFIKLNSDTMKNLQDANAKLREIKGAFDRLENACKDIEALSKIRHSVNVLNIPGIIERDPDRAARAFGELFVGLGRFCRYVEVLKPWQEFFERMGDFFVNVRRGLDPGVRWKKQFDQIEKESGMPMH
jgi:hypothetical protein